MRRTALMFALAPFDDQQSWPDNTAEAVRDALTTTVQRLPDHLWQSLTWDQGKEMAQHAKFSIDSGIQVFFCDPKESGSGEPTRTPTDCSANTFPKEPT